MNELKRIELLQELFNLTAGFTEDITVSQYLVLMSKYKITFLEFSKIYDQLKPSFEIVHALLLEVE